MNKNLKSNDKFKALKPGDSFVAKDKKEICRFRSICNYSGWQFRQMKLSAGKIMCWRVS